LVVSGSVGYVLTGAFGFLEDYFCVEMVEIRRSCGFGLEKGKPEAGGKGGLYEILLEKSEAQGCCPLPP